MGIHLAQFGATVGDPTIRACVSECRAKMQVRLGTRALLPGGNIRRKLQLLHSYKCYKAGLVTFLPLLGKPLATPNLPSTIFYLPNTLGWWNGRHVRLRGVCRKAWGFKSPSEHNCGCAAEVPSANLPPTHFARSALECGASPHLFLGANL